MSRRTFPRFRAAGLLAVAVIAAPPPAVAQSPNPWRPATADATPNPWRTAAADLAPPPREKTTSFEIDIRLDWTFSEPVVGVTAAKPVAPAPRAVTPSRCEAGSCPLCGDAPRVAQPVAPPAATYRLTPAPAAPPLPPPVNGSVWVMPPQFLPAQPAPGTVVRMGQPVAPPAPAVAIVTATRSYQPLGTWYRELPGCVIAFTFRGDECKATATINDNGTIATITLTADCAVTKDGVVHGVITGADVDVTPGKEAGGMEFAALGLELQGFVDQPFAFRFRATDGGLMVSNIRFGGTEGIGGEATAALCGKYKPAASGPVPSPRPAPILNRYSSDPNERMQLLLHNGPGTVVATPFVSPAPCPSRVPSCPPDVFEMMTGTFGQMLSCPPPVPGMPLPSPRFVQPPPRYYVPDAVCPGTTCPVPTNPPVVIGGPAPLPPAGVPVMPPPAPLPTKPALTLSGLAGAGQEFSTRPATAAAKLTLADVIDLTKAGCGEDVIVTQIRKTGSTYDLSVADLKHLKQNGVGDTVILEMQCGTPSVPARGSVPVEFR